MGKKNFQCFYLPILWTTQSCWQRGQRLFCFTHRDMQQLWKEWLHSPQTTTQSSCLFSAWHLRQASMTCTRQMAQVSHSTSQLHMATAFHFFSENILSGPPALEPAEPGCEFQRLVYSCSPPSSRNSIKISVYKSVFFTPPQCSGREQAPMGGIRCGPPQNNKKTPQNLFRTSHEISFSPKMKLFHPFGG